MFQSFARAAIAYGAILLLIGFRASADDVQRLDRQQSEIANKVVDQVIERIKALKPQYPQLAKFGEAPYFTRGDGDFRYDYKIKKVIVDGQPQARALPGGCGFYYRVYRRGAPTSKWFYFYRWVSIGGVQAGIQRELSISVFQKDDHDTANAPLIDAIRKVEENEWETTCAQLTDEYLLLKKGIAIDTPSLLIAAENQDPAIASEAVTVLRSRALTSGQLAQIRQSFLDGKIPIVAGQSVIKIVEEQDHPSLPAFLSDAVAVSLRAEQAGNDTFERTPLFNEPWASQCRILREAVLQALKDGDPLALDPAEKILSSDTNLRNRLSALDYVSKQPEDAAQKVFIGALQNSFRSVQAKAAEIAGQKKVAAAGGALRLLLNSPSSKVRTAAAAALTQLGQSVPDPVPVPPLPDSARQIAAALWQSSLKDEDLLEVHALPWRSGSDARLMEAMDPASVKKAAATYSAPNPKQQFPWEHNLPPGQFLLAAAIKLKDEDSAQLVYGRLCDTYESDDEALYDGLNKLGWDRFSVALDQFHQKNDIDAALHFKEVLAFSDVARPFTLLGLYVKQSHELLDYLKTKAPETDSLPPDRADTSGYVRYWIGQLKECDGSHPSEAGEKIREVGLPALPFLIDAIADRTPTRNFRYGRSYLPERDLIYVGDAARNVIRVICADYRLSPPGFEQFDDSTPRELQAKLRAWLKRVPADSKPLPPEKRDRKVLYPAGEYFWGDD